MGRFFKVVIKILIVFVILLVVAGVAITVLVNPNDYKEEITNAVQDATGRTLTLGGNIDLSLFPWLGLELNDVSLGNADGFGDEPFADVSRAAVKVKLMPLLSRQLEVDRVELNGVMLNLARNAQGVSNWDDLAASGDGKKPEAPVQAPVGDGASSMQPATFTIGGVAIREADINWHDATSGQKAQIKGFRLITGEIAPGESIDIETGFNIDSSEPKLKATFVMEGTVSFSEDYKSVDVSPFEARLTDVVTGEGMSLEATLTASIKADTNKQYYQLAGLKVEADASGGNLPEGGMKAEMTGELLVDLANEVLQLKGLKVHALDLDLTGEINGSKIASKPDVTGSLKLAEFNLAQWMNQMGLPPVPTRDPEVLKKVAFSARIAAAENQVGMEDLRIKLDDTDIDGFVRVVNPQGKPGIRFALNVNEINADRYMPPASEQSGGSGEAPADAASGGDQTSALPMEQLRELDIDGTLKIGKLTINNLKTAGIVVKIKGKNGKINVDESVSQFYQGNQKGSLGLDVTGQQPKFRINNNLSGVQIGELLQDLNGVDKLTGTANLKANLNAAGTSDVAIKRSLNGEVDFTFANGSFKGFNLAKMIRDTKVKLGLAKPVNDTEAPRTDFSEVVGHATIRNGVVNNDTFKAKSPFLRVVGSGTADLNTEQLLYKVKTTIVSVPTGQGGKDLEDLVGVPIPVIYEGPFDGTSQFSNWRIDLQDVAVQQGLNLLKDRVLGKPPAGGEESDESDSSRGGVEDLIPGGLPGGLFGR